MKRRQSKPLKLLLIILEMPGPSENGILGYQTDKMRPCVTSSLAVHVLWALWKGSCCLYICGPILCAGFLSSGALSSFAQGLWPRFGNESTAHRLCDPECAFLSLELCSPPCKGLNQTAQAMPDAPSYRPMSSLWPVTKTIQMAARAQKP